MVTDVVSTSPMESVNTAIITLESIFFPNFLLKNPSHSFTPIERMRIITEAIWKFKTSGDLILPMESFRKVNPTSNTRKDTMSAEIYSIRPCPKGCSSSAGLLAIFTPTKLISDEPASDRLLKASAVTDTLCTISPTINFTMNKNTLHKMPTMLARTPYAVRTDTFSVCS